MRIAMLGHKRVPSREGGVEIVVEELSTRMAALGHQVTCYNRSGKHVSGKEFQAAREKEHKGIRLKWVPTIDAKGIAAMSASFFASFFAAFGPYDVVHFHAEGPCATLWLPKLLGKRCVATIHGLDHQRGKWGRLARGYIMLGEKCAARFADEIIVLSRGNQQYFKETYGRETRFIPNGIVKPEPRQAQEITEKFGLHKDEYILFLGRMVPEKGVHYLIDAFRRLESGKKLVIAGGASDSDGYYQQLKQQAQGDERIILTGFVQGRILEEMYSNAYIFVQPSDLEGMPMALLEAMSYGNCCLTSDIPENAAVVQDLGLTFRKADADHLREQLLRLLENPAMVEAFRSKATAICEQFSWDDIVNRTLELYGGNA